MKSPKSKFIHIASWVAILPGAVICFLLYLLAMGYHVRIRRRPVEPYSSRLEVVLHRAMPYISGLVSLLFTATIIYLNLK